MTIKAYSMDQATPSLEQHTDDIVDLFLHGAHK